MDLIAQILAFALWIFTALLCLRAILSWFPIDHEGPLSSFVTALTEPLLLPVRSLLDRVTAIRRLAFDPSFIVVLIVLQVLIRLL